MGEKDKYNPMKPVRKQDSYVTRSGSSDGSTGACLIAAVVLAGSGLAAVVGAIAAVKGIA
jgi:hypothetical protein